jgi:hypothetical protein
MAFVAPKKPAAAQAVSPRPCGRGPFPGCDDLSFLSRLTIDVDVKHVRPPNRLRLKKRLDNAAPTALGPSVAQPEKTPPPKSLTLPPNQAKTPVQIPPDSNRDIPPALSTLPVTSTAAHVACYQLLDARLLQLEERLQAFVRAELTAAVKAIVDY